MPTDNWVTLNGAGPEWPAADVSDIGRRLTPVVITPEMRERMRNPVQVGIALPSPAAAATLGAVGVAATRFAASSAQLSRNLVDAGFVRPLQSAAHHIVAGGAAAAHEAQAVLQRFGIGINDAANGLFLPQAVHQGLHTNAYYQAVNNMLATAMTRQEALTVLDNIRTLLLGGWSPR